MLRSGGYLIILLLTMCFGCKKDDETSSPVFDKRVAVEQLNNSLVGKWEETNSPAVGFLPLTFTIQKTTYDSGTYSSSDGAYYYAVGYSGDWPDKSSDPGWCLLLMTSGRVWFQTNGISNVTANRLDMTYMGRVATYKRVN